MIAASDSWEDNFDNEDDLEDLNQTLVSNGTVRLNGDVHQAWEISSQVGFQAGTLNQVDAEAISGALQLSPANLSFNANQLISDTPDLSIDILAFYSPPALVSDNNQVLHLAWADRKLDDVFYRCSTDTGQNWTVTESLTNDGNAVFQDSPELIIDSTGKVYAVWHDQQADANGDIYLASRSGCGGSWSTPAPITVAATTGPAQHNPALAIDNSDTLYLAWEQTASIICTQP